MKANILACLALSLLIALTVCAAASPATAAAATPTSTARPTATPHPAVEVRQDCITIEDSLPADLRPGGALLLDGDYQFLGRYGWDTNKRSSMYHLDLMSQRNSPLPYSAQDFSLSPDGKWLAYLDIAYDEEGAEKDRILQVINAEGRHLDMAYWGLNWQTLMGWQDEKHLLIAVPGYPGGDFIRLNPFTMQKEVIAVDLPDLNAKTYKDYSGKIFPSPDLNDWIYETDNQLPAWRLVDRAVARTLWEGESWSDGSPPYWSPNGHYFALMRHFVPSQNKITQLGWILMRIGLDGSEAPLTLPIDRGEKISWSPDGRFLAGWLQTTPKTSYWDSPNHLALIDVEKPLFIDLCLENPKAQDYETLRNLPPVWSPDGRFLAISVSRIDKVESWAGHFWDETFWDTALIDLQEHRAYRLVKDAVPVAWMRKPT